MQADDGEEELVSLVFRLLRRFLDELLPLREGAEVVPDLVGSLVAASASLGLPSIGPSRRRTHMRDACRLNA